jgi:hypothetical protein
MKTAAARPLLKVRGCRLPRWEKQVNAAGPGDHSLDPEGAYRALHQVALGRAAALPTSLRGIPATAQKKRRPLIRARPSPDAASRCPPGMDEDQRRGVHGSARVGFFSCLDRGPGAVAAAHGFPVAIAATRAWRQGCWSTRSRKAQSERRELPRRTPSVSRSAVLPSASSLAW